MIILVISGAVGFLFATSKPLMDVKIVEIENVIATEQELMLDLKVQAINPNAIGVSVPSLDVNVFAKSKYVGSDRYWREHPHGKMRWVSNEWARKKRQRALPVPPDLSADSRASMPVPATSQDLKHRDDDPADPPETPEKGDPLMLLGRILSFDSALTFDASPFYHRPSTSVGEVRLAHPGNKTEDGGTERWEKVLEHEFDLVVRGVLRYQGPLGGRWRTAQVGATVTVDPGQAKLLTSSV
jgi:hypothetical protein